MKLSKKERRLLEKANAELKNPIIKYECETARADRWTRSNIYRNRKAYSRKQKHKPTY